MYFDCQPIPEVEEFIKKHYKGGSIIDYGCGSGRYANCFPDEGYVGVDGHPGNIVTMNRLYPEKKTILADLSKWKPKKKYDYLFSSVVFDQVKDIPKGWAKKYILIEPEKYAKSYKVIINEPLGNVEGTRLMVAEDK